MKTTLRALLPLVILMTLSGCVVHATGTVFDTSNKALPAGTEGNFVIRDPNRGPNAKDRNFTVTSGVDASFHFDVTVLDTSEYPDESQVYFFPASDPSRSFRCWVDSKQEISQHEVAVGGHCREDATAPVPKAYNGKGKEGTGVQNSVDTEDHSATTRALPPSH